MKPETYATKLHEAELDRGRLRLARDAMDETPFNTWYARNARRALDEAIDKLRDEIRRYRKFTAIESKTP